MSRVTVIPEELTISTESIESTGFDSLKSRWKLGEVLSKESDADRDIGNGSKYDRIHCDVDFEVEMTVSDPVVVAVLDQVLQQVAGRQVEAFEKRCKEVPIPYDLIEAAARLNQ